jgi:rhodanese-related sulfurtransferase
MLLLGCWSAPLPVGEVKKLVGEGAKLVDVRDPDEFQQGHLEGAINIPFGPIG